MIRPIVVRSDLWVVVVAAEERVGGSWGENDGARDPDEGSSGGGERAGPTGRHRLASFPRFMGSLSPNPLAVRHRELATTCLGARAALPGLSAAERPATRCRRQDRPSTALVSDGFGA